MYRCASSFPPQAFLYASPYIDCYQILLAHKQKALLTLNYPCFKPGIMKL
jgi:hypothetical protein